MHPQTRWQMSEACETPGIGEPVGSCSQPAQASVSGHHVTTQPVPVQEWLWSVKDPGAKVKAPRSPGRTVSA